MINKFMKGFKKNKKGFTLVELMVVVTIIGILTAIAVPVYNASQKKAKLNAHLANVRILMGAAAQCTANEGNPTTNITWDKSNNSGTEGPFKWGNYLQGWPKNPFENDDDDEGDDAYSVTISTTGQVTVKAGENIVTPNDTDYPPTQ